MDSTSDRHAKEPEALATPTAATVDTTSDRQSTTETTNRRPQWFQRTADRLSWIILLVIMSDDREIWKAHIKQPMERCGFRIPHLKRSTSLKKKWVWQSKTSLAQSNSRRVGVRFLLRAVQSRWFHNRKVAAPMVVADCSVAVPLATKRRFRLRGGSVSVLDVLANCILRIPRWQWFTCRWRHLFLSEFIMGAVVIFLLAAGFSCNWWAHHLLSRFFHTLSSYCYRQISIHYNQICPSASSFTSLNMIFWSIKFLKAYTLVMFFGFNFTINPLNLVVKMLCFSSFFVRRNKPLYLVKSPYMKMNSIDKKSCITIKSAVARKQEQEPWLVSRLWSEGQLLKEAFGMQVRGVSYLRSLQSYATKQFMPITKASERVCFIKQLRGSLNLRTIGKVPAFNCQLVLLIFLSLKNLVNLVLSWFSGFNRECDGSRVYSLVRVHWSVSSYSWQCWSLLWVREVLLCITLYAYSPHPSLVSF